MTEREALQGLVDCWVEAGPSMLARWADAWADAKEVLGRPAVDDPVAAMWAKVDAAKAGDPVSAVQDQLARRTAQSITGAAVPKAGMSSAQVDKPSRVSDPPAPADDLVTRLRAEEESRAFQDMKASDLMREAADRIVALEYKVELLRAELQLCRTVEPGSGEST